MAGAVTGAQDVSNSRLGRPAVRKLAQALAGRISVPRVGVAAGDLQAVHGPVVSCAVLDALPLVAGGVAVNGLGVVTHVIVGAIGVGNDAVVGTHGCAEHIGVRLANDQNH